LLMSDPVGRPDIAATAQNQAEAGLFGDPGLFGLTADRGLNGLFGVAGETGVFAVLGVLGVSAVFGVLGVFAVFGVIAVAGVAGVFAVFGDIAVLGVTGVGSTTFIASSTAVSATASDCCTDSATTSELALKPNGPYPAAKAATGVSATAAAPPARIHLVLSSIVLIPLG